MFEQNLNSPIPMGVIPVTVKTVDGVDVISMPSEKSPDELIDAMNMISDIDLELKRAEDEMNSIHSRADGAKRQATDLKQETNNIRINNNFSTSIFKRGKTLESLKDSQTELLKSQISTAGVVETVAEVQHAMTIVESETVEVTKNVLKNQAKLIGAIEYVYVLGVTGVASAESVIQQLELKLNGASKEKITEFAQHQIEQTISRLKAQETLAKKQASLENDIEMCVDRLNDDADSIARLENEVEVVKKKGRRQDDTISEHTRLIKENQKLDSKQDAELAERRKKDQEQDELLHRGAEKDSEQDERLASIGKKNEEHEKELLTQKEKDKEHDELLKIREEKDAQHDSDINLLKKALNEVENSIEVAMNSILECNNRLRDADVAMKRNRFATIICGGAGIAGFIMGLISMIL